MPTDEWGNRADVIIDGDSTIKRMNPGRLFEHYTKAVMRKVTHRVRKLHKAGDMVGAWNELVQFYTIASPKMALLVETAINGHETAKQKHIDYVVKNGVYLWLPTETKHVGTDMIRKLRDHYQLKIGPITYRGRSGRVTKTQGNALIGGMYILLLEKVGDDWSAVASPKRQHFGLLSKLTNADKNSRPWREQCVKFEGESEFRLITAMCGPEFANEIAEIANSPAVMKDIILSILRAPDPSNINAVIDRSKLGGRSRALLFVKNIMECAGMVFRRKA